MSSKHVPEVAAPSRNEQLATLRTRLLGNQYFAACRGMLGQVAIKTVDEMIGATNNPSQFSKSWEKFSQGVLVMGNMLAQLQRDGWQEAYTALSSALSTPGYTIPGETVPFEQTKPITLVMLDPERTVLMLNWIIKDHWMDLDAWLDDKDDKPDSRKLSERVKKLFELFPTLEHHTRIRRKHRDYEGKDLLYAYRDSVWSRFPNVLKSESFKSLRFTFGQWNDHIELHGAKFLFLFDGEQGEALKLFTREQQEQIATWQINIPSAAQGTIYFGLHPEAEQETWRAEYPSLLSHGLNAGMGAVMLTSKPAVQCGMNYGPPQAYQAQSGEYPNTIDRFIFDNGYDMFMCSLD
jgi:hypothetical protein